MSYEGKLFIFWLFWASDSLFKHSSGLCGINAAKWICHWHSTGLSILNEFLIIYWFVVLCTSIMFYSKSYAPSYSVINIHEFLPPCYFVGVLKDYLRELPSPLITKQLYEAVLHAMAEKPLKMSGNGCENDLRDSEHTVELLNWLPDVERVSTSITTTKWYTNILQHYIQHRS